MILTAPVQSTGIMPKKGRECEQRVAAIHKAPSVGSIAADNLLCHVMKPFRRARHSWHVGDQKPEADSSQQQLEKLKTVYEERESTPLVLPSLHLNPASPRRPKSKQLWRKAATVVSTARVGGTKVSSPPPDEAPVS